jgi:hypothetical protein
MNRRDFIASIIGASAVIALAKTVGAEPVAVPKSMPTTEGMKRYIVELPAMVIDKNCPEDRVYAVNFKEFFGNPPYTQPNPHAAAMMRLK